jgi:hypothetical protein
LKAAREGKRVEVDPELADLFHEYQYYKALGGAPSYEETSAWKTSWFIHFDEMEAARERSQNEQPTRRRH